MKFYKFRMLRDASTLLVSTAFTSSNENVEPRLSRRTRTESSFHLDFMTIFLTKSGEINELDDLEENFVHVFILEEDPRSYEEAMSSIDSKF